MQLNEPSYLLNEQYKDASKLGARMRLHQLYSQNTYGWQRWVFDRLQLPAQARVLELGGGPGKLWAENADRLPSEWDVTLSDFSPGMLAQAQENLCEVRGVSFRWADAQAIPFGDAMFDGVVANHMLYHVPGKAQALSEIRRVLKSGGRFYAATNGDGHMRELDALVRRFDADLIDETDEADAKGRVNKPGFSEKPGLFTLGTAVEAAGRKYGIEQIDFTMQNGVALLSPYFAHVQLHRYEDGLLVTEAAPLVNYILSSITDVTEAHKQALTAFVERELATSADSIHIRKESGLFICS